MIRLKSHNAVPPGQFFYEQLFIKDGRKLKKQWQRTPEIGSLAAKVAAFRKGNGLPRSGIVDSLEDIDTATCRRLNNNPRWVMDTDIPWDKLVAAAHGPGCRTCGGTPTNP